MIDPSWLADILAAVVLATALYCVGRIVLSLTHKRRVQLDTDITHILMGIGMSGMFVTRLAIFNSTVWGVVFGLVAVWYAARIFDERTHDGGRQEGLRHHVGHLVSALAMLYMFLALPATAATSSTGGSSMGMGGGSGMGAHVPTLALVFAVALFGYAVLVADRIPLTATAPAPAQSSEGDTRGAGVGSEPTRGRATRRLGLGTGSGTLLAPRGSALCEVVMSVAMGVMLIAML
jgi:hypothetical protein